MIITKLQGGLGNQLFQYAFARALSLRYNTPFAFDLENYKNEYLPDSDPQKKYNNWYRLFVFNTILNLAPESLIKKYKKYRKKNGKKWYIYNKIIANESLYIVQHDFTYKIEYACPTALKSGKTIYIDGYWMSEKYFKEYEGTIRKDLTFNVAPDETNLKYTELIVKSESVSIHIRRGDFAKPPYNKIHGLCPLSYYEQAIDYMMKRIENPTFFVFSNDPEWAKENLKFNKPVYFIDNNLKRDYDDLRLMSTCKHHIIANSSFSWWGAWLSTNKDKTVIYPSQLTHKKIDLKDYTPESWTKIDIELL